MADIGQPVRHLEVKPEKAPVISDPMTPGQIEREKQERQQERERQKKREKEREREPAKT